VSKPTTWVKLGSSVTLADPIQVTQTRVLQELSGSSSHKIVKQSLNCNKTRVNILHVDVGNLHNAITQEKYNSYVYNS
jgi:hypothetical protein